MNVADFMVVSMALGATLTTVGIAARVYSKRLKFRERELEIQAEVATARAMASGGETGKLEQRLRVLERIATDKGTALTAEIEALREKDPA